MEDIKEVLSVCFEGLEGAELESVATDLYGAFEEVELKEHDVVFKDGDTNRELYLIVDGKVRISKEITGGGNKVLAILEKGAIFGEGSLLSGKPRGATATAITGVKAMRLKYEDFEKLQMDSPGSTTRLLMGIVKIVNKRLQYVNMELITLYDVTRILGSSPGDLSTTAAAVLSKFLEVSEAEYGMIFVHNPSAEKEDTLAVSEKSDADFVSSVTVEVEKVAKYFMDNTGQRFKNDDGKLLWIPIRNFQGKYLGMVVLQNSEGEFVREEVKLALAISDQLGVAFERHYQVEEGKEKEMLKQERVEF